MSNKRKRAAKQAANDHQPPQKRAKKDASSATLAGAKALDKSPFVERPTTVDERKREMLLYETLGSEDPKERTEAAEAVVSALLGGDGVPEPVLLRHLEKRLFRGLASSRNASRLGCGEALIDILGQLFGKKGLASSKYTGLPFEKVLGILVEKTKPGGGATGQEERDHYIGRLFGLECFIRAGIVSADKARWFAVLDLLLELSAKKSWLRSPSGSLIAVAISLMDKKLAEKTLERLAEKGVAKTPEGVGVWVTALDRFPDMKVPSQPWRHPLAAASLPSLAATLKDSGREASNEESGGAKPKQGGWTAQLHFVWDPILAHFVSASTQSESDAAEQFKQFWSRVVDEGFFSKSASDSQKFSGFMIFQKMIHGAAAKASCLVPSLFSKNFMVCLMNQAAKEDRYLHRAALKALKGIEVAVEETPSLLPIVLKGLLGKHGAYNFDQRTNTKTVDKLLQYTTPTTVKAVLKILRLKDPEKTGLDGTKYYQALGGYLFRLSSVPSKPLGADSSSESVTGPAIRALTELAYSNKSVPTNVRDALRTRSTSAFAKLVRRPEDFGHLCNAILSIDADVDQDDEIASALADAKKMLKDLLDPAKETDRTRAPRQALALLYAVGILQFYNQEPDVIDLFEELRECYDKLANRSRGSDEGMPEYLVEILLAMVARPSSLMRQVSHQVFEAFTGFLSEEALKLLTDPLAAEESEKGQQALFATEDEDVMEAEAADADESDEGELDSDVEMVNLKDAGSEGPDSSDEASADEQDEDADGEDKDQEALDALDNALAEVLGSHRLDKDNEADSAEESDMTDSEMLAVDEKLAEIFRQRAKTTSKKKEKKDAKDTVINFKHRVLDLLAIFVRQEAARPRVNTLVFHVLLPLLHLVRTTKTKPLANKACDIIHALPKALKKARSSSGGGGGGGSRQAAAGEAAVGEKDAKALLALLAQLHDEAAGQDSNPSHAYANAVSTASLAVASVLWGDAACRERVAGVYARTQLRWIQGRARIQPGFFLDWVNWCQSKVNNAVEAATAAPTQA